MAEQPEQPEQPEPAPVDYNDGTWYVPVGSNSYVKKPKE